MNRLNDFDVNADNLRVDVPENTILTIARMISGSDRDLIESIKAYLDDAETYLDNNKGFFEQREGVDLEDTELVSWIALIKELKLARYVYEFKWKEDLDKFLSTLKESEEVKMKDLPLIKEWFSPDETVVEWCEILDKKWESFGVCIAAIDLDCDSYILFPCDMVKFHNLNALSQITKHRIDLGKNM